MNKRIKRLYLFLTLKVLFPWQYNRFRKLPLQKGKVVFIEANLTQLSGSLRFLYHTLLEKPNLQVSVQYLQESGNKGKFIKNALRCLKDIADAEYIFLCEGSRVIGCIDKRTETTVTQLWHGCGAFKKFGFSTADDKFGGSREEYLKYNYYGNYDYITVSSPEVIWAYREAMNLPEDTQTIVPAGISCTDVLFQEHFQNQAREKLFTKWPEAEGRKLLLYAPTFRGSVGEAKAPDALNIEKLQKELGEEWVLAIKHHPMVKKRPEIPKGCQNTFAMDVSEEFTIEELLPLADALISDYSSLVFEYSLFERPMLFFAYDFEEYGDWRGFYYNYDELTPGPVMKTNEELIECLQNLNSRFDREKMKVFKTTYMSACDGHATRRLLQLIGIEKESIHE